MNLHLHGEPVSYELSETRANITLNRPQIGKALSAAMVEGFAEPARLYTVARSGRQGRRWRS